VDSSASLPTPLAREHSVAVALPAAGAEHSRGREGGSAGSSVRGDINTNARRE
jgi:hypothetical protein